MSRPRILMNFAYFAPASGDLKSVIPSKHLQQLQVATESISINIAYLSFWQSMRKDENSVICCSTEVRFLLHELHTRRDSLFSHFLPYIVYDRIIFGFLIGYIVCSSIFHVCSMFVHCLFLFCFHDGSVVAFFLSQSPGDWRSILCEGRGL